MTARVQSQCTPSCARYLSPFSPRNTAGVVACDAFPQGIPDPIWNNQVDHRQPVDGDHGLQWSAKEGYEYPTYALPPGPTGQGVLVAAGPGVHTGAMIALVPADPYQLEVDAGEPVDELHCTLLFLGDTADLNPGQRTQIVAAVEKTVAGQSEITADAFGLATFNPLGDEPCLVLLLSGPDLADLHDDITDAVPPPVEQHRPWIPHITLAYSTDVPMLADLLDLCGPVVFDRVRVAFGGETFDIPLEPADQHAPVEEPGEAPTVEAGPVVASATIPVERAVWDGCPRGMHPVHDGPCPTGL
jgi:2'-5' RNA ligase